MDIQMKFDPERQTGDFVLLSGDLAIDRDLETAILVSLFTDRRADAGDRIPDGSADLRGCSLSPVNRRVYECVRGVVPPVAEDRAFGVDVDAMNELVRSGKLIELVSECCPEFA